MLNTAGRLPLPMVQTLMQDSSSKSHPESLSQAIAQSLLPGMPANSKSYWPSLSQAKPLGIQEG